MIFRHVHKIARGTNSFDMSVCLLSIHLSAWNNLAPTGQTFRNSIILKSVEKIHVSLKCDMNNGYFT